MASKIGEMRIGHEEYVVLPRAEYLRLVRREPSDDGDTVEAMPALLASLGRDLRAAREHAGLTQRELAAKLGKAQTTVSQSEKGAIRVSDDYVAALLRACELPKDWPAEPRAKTKRPTRKR